MVSTNQGGKYGIQGERGQSMPTDQGILNQQKADKSQASVSITNYFDTEPNSSSFVAERDEARHSL
jgi:hypothetical protein